MSESEYLKRPDAKGYLRVRDALRRWDPIGVFRFDADWPEDEYDGYIAPIVRLLDRGVTAEGLANVLEHIATESMGVRADPERDRAIAKELVDFWEEWKGS